MKVMVRTIISEWWRTVMVVRQYTEGEQNKRGLGGNYSKRRSAKRNSQDLIALPTVYMLKEENRKYLMQHKDGRKREI